jgi:hypothetical protein
MIDGRMVRIEQDGRGGAIVVTLPAGEMRWWWEFGGGDCLAFVHVPDGEQWESDPRLRAYPRAAFLAELGAHIAARQCPGARIVVGERFIEFYG